MVHEDNSPVNPYDVGHLIALAYPERIAKVSDEGVGLYRLASGETASVAQQDMLSSYDWLAVASLGARIFLAAPLRVDGLESLMVTKDVLTWDNRQGTIIARRERRIGRIIVDSRPLHDIPPEDIIRTLCEAAPKYGLSMFNFNDKVSSLQRRIETVRGWHPDLGLPDVSTESVLTRAADWLLSPDIRKVDICSAVWSLLSYDQQQAVDRLAPTHITVPTGSRIRVEYRQGAELPVLRVRLQECFGMQDTPRIDDGRQPVLLELLSPGFKPVQLTQDLRHFWQSTYFEVRKELRRRYPKHAWPDNPLEAPPTRGVKHKVNS